MIAGKEVSFQTVPKNSHRWSWGDVGRQTVPEAASSCRFVVSVVFCAVTISPAWLSAVAQGNRPTMVIARCVMLISSLWMCISALLMQFVRHRRHGCWVCCDRHSSVASATVVRCDYATDVRAPVTQPRSLRLASSFRKPIWSVHRQSDHIWHWVQRHFFDWWLWRSAPDKMSNAGAGCSVSRTKSVNDSVWISSESLM